jgi:hypothetical protein
LNKFTQQKTPGMKLRVGDKVKFLNDTGGGEVTRIINKDMVNVLNDDGFEVPVLAEELLKIEEEGGSRQEQVFSAPEPEVEEINLFEQDEPEPESLESASDPDNNIYIAFVPEDQNLPENSSLDLYLINDSEFHIFYLILLKRTEHYVHFSSGELESNTKVYLKNIERENLSEMKDFKFQFIFYQKGFFNPFPPVERDLKLKPQKFYKSTTFMENDFFEEYAHLIELKKEAEFTEKLNKLTDQEIDRVIKEKDLAHPKNKKNNKPENSELKEIDLHIEELVDRPKDLSNREMLEIQMEHFHKEMNEALKHPTLKKIVFIHGVGNGRLRYELRKSLERNYTNFDYQDASFKEYGYGATLVILKK